MPEINDSTNELQIVRGGSVKYYTKEDAKVYGEDYVLNIEFNDGR